MRLCLSLQVGYKFRFFGEDAEVASRVGTSTRFVACPPFCWHAVVSVPQKGWHAGVQHLLLPGQELHDGFSAPTAPACVCQEACGGRTQGKLSSCARHDNGLAQMSAQDSLSPHQRLAVAVEQLD